MVSNMYYINYFFLLSVCGHLIESFFSNGEPGILFSYWTPIYGIGAIIILLVNKRVNKIKYNLFFKILTLFIISSIVLSSIELLGGYLINLIFHKELWNYSNHLFNIGRYTSLEMSLLWGICSILFIYLIKPIVDKFIKKIPSFISYMCITLFIIDTVATIMIKT